MQSPPFQTSYPQHCKQLMRGAKVVSVLQNCWVVYESIDPEADEAAAMLRVWDSSQNRRGPFTLDLEAWIKLPAC